MPDLNKVFLMGRLTKDPELRYTAGGAAWPTCGSPSTGFTRWQSGEKKEEVCYVTVVVWRKTPRPWASFSTRAIPFRGGLPAERSWETEDKQKRSVMEVVADRIQFLNRGKGGSGESAPTRKTRERPRADPLLPRVAVRKTSPFNLIAGRMALTNPIHRYKEKENGREKRKSPPPS